MEQLNHGKGGVSRFAALMALSGAFGEDDFGDIIHRPAPEMGHDSLLMGDYLGDLIGDDDDIGDLLGYDDDMGEMGRRRRKLKKLNRLARKQGLVVLPKEAAMEAAREAAQANSLARSAAVSEAAYSGLPVTARGALAVSAQRELVLPFGTLSLANTLGATGTVTTNVQRDIQLKRFVMTATDAVAFGDASATVGVSLIKIGSDIVFNANGVVPLSMFAPLSVGVSLMTQPGTTGTLVEITFVRTVATANAAVIMAAGVGFSAGSR